jgi:hypothetical protein
MKIVRKVNAPASFIFEQIIKSSLDDVWKATGKKLSLEELKGFEYEKTFKTKQTATIKILEMIENQVYQFQAITSIRNFTTTYTLRDLPNNKSEITCEESYETKGQLLKWNDMLAGIALGWQKKRQMNFMFDAMAQEYSSK